MNTASLYELQRVQPPCCNTSTLVLGRLAVQTILTSRKSTPWDASRWGLLSDCKSTSTHNRLSQCCKQDTTHSSQYCKGLVSNLQILLWHHVILMHNNTHVTMLWRKTRVQVSEDVACQFLLVHKDGHARLRVQCEWTWEETLIVLPHIFNIIHHFVHHISGIWLVRGDVDGRITWSQ